jgi:hypothetical protein
MECVHSYMRQVSAYAAPVPGGSLAVVAHSEIHFFSGKALDRASASSRAQMGDHFAVLEVFAMEGKYRSCMWGSLLPGVPDVTMGCSLRRRIAVRRTQGHTAHTRSLACVVVVA